MQCKSLCNAIPPFFILVIIIWSYYTYIVVFCLHFFNNLTKRIIYITFYHLLLVVFMWCYLQTIFKLHKPVPEEYHLTPDEHARLIAFSDEEQIEILKKMILARNLDIHCLGRNGTIRYCKTCRIIKPDRTHHCSICERCILKMDHHCPWIVNCVGFSNYKYFILMLFYGTLLCLYCIGTMSEYFITIFEHFDRDFKCMVVGIGFAVGVLVAGLLLVLFTYHLSMICENETTLESLYGVTFREDNVTFNIGKWYNFTEVFGDNVCCWLVPTETYKGNGHEFQHTNLIPLSQK